MRLLTTAAGTQQHGHSQGTLELRQGLCHDAYRRCWRLGSLSDSASSLAESRLVSSVPESLLHPTTALRVTGVRPRFKLPLGRLGAASAFAMVLLIIQHKHPQRNRPVNRTQKPNCQYLVWHTPPHSRQAGHPCILVPRPLQLAPLLIGGRRNAVIAVVTASGKL